MLCLFCFVNEGGLLMKAGNFLMDGGRAGFAARTEGIVFSF